MNAHTLWYGRDRAPRDIKFASDAVGYFARLSDEQRDFVNEVHIFAQQCTIEDGRLSPNTEPAQALECLPLVGGTLRRLQITIRHTGMLKFQSLVLFLASKDCVQACSTKEPAQADYLCVSRYVILPKVL